MADVPSGAAKQLKSVALKGGATVCGIADAAAFAARAPEKQRPDDLLPGARSVVVVGESDSYYTHRYNQAHVELYGQR